MMSDKKISAQNLQPHTDQPSLVSPCQRLGFRIHLMCKSAREMEKAHNTIQALVDSYRAAQSTHLGSAALCLSNYSRGSERQRWTLYQCCHFKKCQTSDAAGNVLPEKDRSRSVELKSRPTVSTFTLLRSFEDVRVVFLTWSISDWTMAQSFHFNIPYK